MLSRALIFLALAAHSFAAVQVAFTVSMQNPSAHTFHVRMRCEGLRAPLEDFQMPQWSTGYYGIMNFSRYVSNFRATDGAGRALVWDKTARNTWRVVSGNSPAILLEYDVFGATAFSASNYLGEDRAFLSPAGLFVHPSGILDVPVTLELETPPALSNKPHISTGLDPVNGKASTFSAPNFDVLYDCPILIGSHERLMFEVRGVPHYVAVENVPASVSRMQMTADLKAIVTAATNIFGEAPYRHYTFLMMGRGGGGIEHSNSSANQFDGESLTKPAGYLRWLSFIAHEYFHNFNVKRIRPLALGPFDYDQENLTDLLWVSEGISVYYQDLLLVRAGLMSREQYLDKMAAAIAVFENAPGRNYQSATESSLNTWSSGSGVAGDRNTTISYYNNGAMLGAMLELNIRAASANRRSLDDVMRGLYRKYYVQQKRGFTAAEFRTECETAAGAPLGEVFEYASTSREVDYARHFALAGLRLDMTSAPTDGGYIGLHTSTREVPPSELPLPTPGRGGGGRGGAPVFRLIVTDTAPGSPAANAALQAGDVVISVDGTPASASVLQKTIESKPASIKLRIARHGDEQDVTVQVAPNFKRSYRFTESTELGLKRSILEGWLRREGNQEP
ncbi:MAG TPA: PDZ domain-containing protein [Bryobacteraceae bacterium]|nr:PDZ domain-containing protein [Bryobacteraceae bacterium]